MDYRPNAGKAVGISGNISVTSSVCINCNTAGLSRVFVSCPLHGSIIIYRLCLFAESLRRSVSGVIGLRSSSGQLNALRDLSRLRTLIEESGTARHVGSQTHNSSTSQYVMHVRRQLIYQQSQSGRLRGFTSIWLRPRVAAAGSMADVAVGPWRGLYRVDEKCSWTLAAHTLSERYYLRQLACCENHITTVERLLSWRSSPWCSLVRTWFLCLCCVVEAWRLVSSCPCLSQRHFTHHVANVMVRYNWNRHYYLTS